MEVFRNGQRSWRVLIHCGCGINLKLHVEDGWFLIDVEEGMIQGGQLDVRLKELLRVSRLLRCRGQ